MNAYRFNVECSNTRGGLDMTIFTTTVSGKAPMSTSLRAERPKRGAESDLHLTYRQRGKCKKAAKTSTML
jgi:hypothetical protein